MCVGGWAEIVTSTTSSPFPYGLRSVSGGTIASDLSWYHAAADDQSDKHGFFIFIETEDGEGYYKIYEMTEGKYFSAKSGFSTSAEAQTEYVEAVDDATIWYVRLNDAGTAYLVSPKANTSCYLNFHGGNNDRNKTGSVGFHTNGNNDDGSFWKLVEGPQLGNAVSELEDGKVYIPQCVGHSSYLEEQVGTNDKRLYLTYDANFSTNYTGNKLISYMWKAHTTEGKWKFENVSTGNYISSPAGGWSGSTVGQANAGIYEVYPIEDATDFQFAIKDANRHWDGNGNNGNSSGTFTTWTSASETVLAGSNGAYRFCEVEGFEYFDLADVDFGSIITNENNYEIVVSTRKQFVGFPANNNATVFNLPYYSSITAATGETIVKSTGTKVVGTCESSLPFTPGNFYAVKLRTGTRQAYMYWNGTDIQTQNTTVEKGAPNTSWRFVRAGNSPYFEIRCAAKQQEDKEGFGIQTNGVESGTANVTLGKGSSWFYPAPNSAQTDGFQMMWADATQQLGDHKDSKLAIWASGSTNDDGSCFVIEDVTSMLIEPLQHEISTILQNVEGGNVVGFPSSLTDSDILYGLYLCSVVTPDNYNIAEIVLSNLSDDIILPESGKAYYFVNYQMNSNDDKRLTAKWMIKYNDDHTLGTEAYTGQEPSDANIFYCRKEGNRFVFVSKDGYYLRHYGRDHANALSKQYEDENTGSIVISKQGLNGSHTQVPISECVGMVTLKGYRPNKSKDCEIIVNGQNGYYDNTDGSIIRYNSESDQYSTAFRIMEVENPNKVKLTKPATTVEGGLNGKYVGTFSAPYDVELSNGIEAYVSETNADNTVITLNKLGNGNLVPRNTGVLLYAENANSNILENARPAIATVSMDGITNKFVGTNAASVIVSDETNAYILAKKDSKGVAFYLLSESDRTIARNKAYLVLPEAATPSPAFVFGFEDLTGFKSAWNVNANAPIFDLMGNKIACPIKGQIYIQNGKPIKY